MGKVFLIGDTHFSHNGMCVFTDNNGNKVRPWDDPCEMDSILIENWNRVVGDHDKVYHLGDVCMKKRELSILEKLKGDKVLIRGNHDFLKDKDYYKYFRELRAYHVMNGMILSHIPIHTDSLGRFGTNIHAHTHGGSVLLPDGSLDKRYYCVSVEQINYTPILFEQVIKNIEDMGGKVGFKEKAVSLSI